MRTEIGSSIWNCIFWYYFNIIIVGREKCTLEIDFDCKLIETRIDLSFNLITVDINFEILNLLT